MGGATERKTESRGSREIRRLRGRGGGEASRQVSAGLPVSGDGVDTGSLVTWVAGDTEKVIYKP